jgi:hypothetical protein
MTRNPARTIILGLSLPMTGLIVVAGYVGLSVHGFYSRETMSWTAQAYGQDAVDLYLIVPALIITGLLAARGKRAAALLWGGVVLYIMYTYVIYCFDVHFNQLFIVYCLTLGLSFYAFACVLFMGTKEPVADWFSDALPLKTIGTFLLAIPCVFYVLWLSEIIPATMGGSIPQSIIDAGLPTNPVHVMDLSVLLPGMCITGALFVKRKSLGFLLAPIMLTFMMLMDITIGAMIVVMNMKGLAADYTVLWVMSVLALASAFMLILLLKYMRPR